MPDDDTVAAALAALERYLAGEQSVEDQVADAPALAWRTAGKLAAQGLPPARSGAAGWASADRARRDDRWSYGIVGL